jgi:hypothetical protein
MERKFIETACRQILPNIRLASTKNINPSTLKTLIWAGSVSCIGEIRNVYRIVIESFNWRHKFKELDTGEIMLWEGQCNGLDCIRLVRQRNRIQAPVYTTTDFPIIRFFVIKLNKCTNFTNLFCHETLYVSESSSVHHQEFIYCTLSNGIRHRGM